MRLGDFEDCYVATEGGPIIIGPSDSVAKWVGVEGDDYNFLIEQFGKNPDAPVIQFTFNGIDSVAWDIGGGGLVYLFETESGIGLVRAWPSSKNEDEAPRILAKLPRQKANSCCKIRNHSGCLLIGWSAESFVGTETDVSGVLRPNLDLAVEDSVITLPLSTGLYACTNDSVESSVGIARRLFLDRT